MSDEVKSPQNADEVIDALGGTMAVSRLLKVNPRSVSNWRSRGLPPETFVALTTALNGKGLRASPSLWKMRAATI